MSENTTATDAGQADNTNDKTPVAFTPITSQEDFDKAIQARIAREQSKYSDYADLKAKAEKLNQIEEANKTELQKAQDALLEAQAKTKALEVANLRAQVAEAKGVPSTLLTGDTKEAIEAAADALLSFKGQTPSAPKSDALGRTNTSSTGGTTSAQFAEAISHLL